MSLKKKKAVTISERRIYWGLKYEAEIIKDTHHQRQVK